MDLSLRFVLALEAAWIVVVSVTVKGSDLLRLDEVHATSAQGISDLVVANAGVWLACAVQLIAAAVVGIGLHRRSERFRREPGARGPPRIERRDPGGTAPAVTTLKHAILVTVVAAAGITEAAGIPVSAMLAVAGLTGGHGIRVDGGCGHVVRSGPHAARPRPHLPSDDEQGDDRTRLNV